MADFSSLSRRRFLAAGAALPVLAASGSVLAAPERGIVGSLAPELDFKVLENRENLIVLKFWQSWCPGCHRHGLPALKKISDTLADNPRVAFAAVQTAFEGLSTNSPEKVEEIQAQYELALPVGHADPKHRSQSDLPISLRFVPGTDVISVGCAAPVCVRETPRGQVRCRRETNRRPCPMALPGCRNCIRSSGGAFESRV